jgi:hypothetical protein
MALLFGFVFSKYVELCPPLIFQPFFFFPIRSTLCFHWLPILEHLFFNCFTSCGNITFTTFTYVMNVCVSTTSWTFITIKGFPWNKFYNLTNFGLYHFMSIQTTNVACIWRCLLWFLTWLCYVYDYHHGLLLFSACFHIVVCHPIICATFISIFYITFCFYSCYLFRTLWY